MLPGGKAVHRTETFIVRFWKDSQWDDPDEWRGIVIHVQSGERVPVGSHTEAADVISTFLVDTPSSPPRLDGEQ